MYGRATALAAAVAVAAAGMAQAHGPTRKKVEETVEIEAPAAKVWEAIGNFQDMSWHPAVTDTSGENGNEVDATRRLTLQGGGTIDEVLYKYDPQKMTYSYRITDVAVEVLPVTNYSSHLSVVAVDEDTSRVEWRGAFYRGYPNNDPPEHLNDQAAIDAVTGVYRGGLDHLKTQLESGS